MPSDAEVIVHLHPSYEREAIAQFLERFADQLAMDDLVQSVRDGSYLALMFPRREDDKKDHA